MIKKILKTKIIFHNFFYLSILKSKHRNTGLKISQNMGRFNTDGGAIETGEG